MLTINLKDDKAGFSSLVDGAMRGEFVTITRHGKPVAALVSVEAAEVGRWAIERKRIGLVAYLRTFPGRCVRTGPVAVAGCGALIETL